MKTAERARVEGKSANELGTEIEMEGFTIKGLRPLVQEQRFTNYDKDDFRFIITKRADGSSTKKSVFTETFDVGGKQIVLVKGSELRHLSGLPGLEGFRTYNKTELLELGENTLVGSSGDGFGWTEVPENSFVTEAYASSRKRKPPPEPTQYINPQAYGRALNNPRYESIKPRLDEQGMSRKAYERWLSSVNELNPEWLSWYDKNIKDNPAYRSTLGSDADATVYIPHVKVGVGFHFIPDVTLDGKPVYFVDDAGDFTDERRLGERVRRLKRPHGYDPDQYAAELAQMMGLKKQSQAISFTGPDGYAKEKLVIDGVERKTSDLTFAEYKNEEWGRSNDQHDLHRLASNLREKLNRSDYSIQTGEYRKSELKPEKRPHASGADIAEAYKGASTGRDRGPPLPGTSGKPTPPAPIEPAPPPEPRPEPPSSFTGFEMPVVDTLKGRRRVAKRRFPEPQELTDE